MTTSIAFPLSEPLRVDYSTRIQVGIKGGASVVTSLGNFIRGYGTPRCEEDKRTFWNDADVALLKRELSIFGHAYCSPFLVNVLQHPHPGQLPAPDAPPAQAIELVEDYVF